MEAQKHPEGLCISHRVPSDFSLHRRQRGPGWAQTHCLPWGFGDWAEGVLVSIVWSLGGREVVQRGRQEASAPCLLEKCGLGVAMGLAPASPTSLRTDICPQSFYMRPEDCEASRLGWGGG